MSYLRTSLFSSKKYPHFLWGIILMELKEAKRFLKRISRYEVDVQQYHQDKINKAFKVFWKSEPKEKEFEKVTDGLLLTPIVMYTMVKK